MSGITDLLGARVRLAEEIAERETALRHIDRLLEGQGIALDQTDAATLLTTWQERHLARRDIVAPLLADGMSLREIEAATGVGFDTVRRIRLALARADGDDLDYLATYSAVVRETKTRRHG